MRPTIREYDPLRDQPALRQCVIELQDAERSIEPSLPDGQSSVDTYLAHLFRRCHDSAGRIFVADVSGTVAGFVSVLGQVSPRPDEEQASYAEIQDLVVMRALRRRGIARSLLLRAEAWARECGAGRVRITVLAANTKARALYQSARFSEYQVQLTKSLR